MRLATHSLQSFCYPDLDNGLSGNTEAVCFVVESFNHPKGKIHVYPTLLVAWTASLREIEEFCDVLTVVELLIKFFCLHRKFGFETPSL